MKAVLKILFACIVAGAWYHLNGDEQAPVAIIILILLLLISFMKMPKYQDPATRDAYRQKIKDARERKMAIEKKQKEEKILLKKQQQEEEDFRKQQLKSKLKL
ncbi:hypothetical protein BKH43_07345 [Helicobacter sp. 13S00401-1]|uniref:hypothetical protein n=1 Tax=Helicobacter sp. 13S00401-1 TaxID=1905758 RepID=UPI000BA67768|nr:hypothetical protein [Helicobacter sp. 13S00401-1]PAF49052.1 hypothetical protein BKH43_07345 [Helicobacter sp. 13S00401-1]